MTRQVVIWITALFTWCSAAVGAKAAALVPMDDAQTDHLAAYGLIHELLQKAQGVEWLLGYRGGSFLVRQASGLEERAKQGAVVVRDLDAEAVAAISEQIATSRTMAIVSLAGAPRVAVYSPPVTPASGDLLGSLLQHCNIAYTPIWDREVLKGDLGRFDVLMIPHGDFTGQFGKFYASFRNTDWYKADVEAQEANAQFLGFKKVAHLKAFVVEEIRNWVARGGFLFAMCSGTDTFDIALAASGIDICAAEFDGDAETPDFNEKLDYSRTLAFTDFTLIQNPYIYEFSDIDMTQDAYRRGEDADIFVLHEFPAKDRPIPAMLVQCHQKALKGFMGQTTSFNKDLLKDDIVVLAEPEDARDVRYIGSSFGNGYFAWLGGHDPEDWQRRIGDAPTDPALHRNSPAYRLILNCLFALSARLR